MIDCHPLLPGSSRKEISAVPYSYILITAILVAVTERHNRVDTEVSAIMGVYANKKYMNERVNEPTISSIQAVIRQLIQRDKIYATELSGG